MEKAGQYLKKLRQKCGYTLDEVAAMIPGGTEKTTISRVENGERKVSLMVAYCMAEIYGVELEEIVKVAVGKVKIKKPKK